MYNHEEHIIETKEEVKAYLARLKYALQSGAQITFQIDRLIEEQREERYRNRFTVADLFPDEKPASAIKRELLTLTEREYIKTVKDNRYSGRSEMREFGKTYNGNRDVYIKIRIELLGTDGRTPVFVMSFHYAMFPFKKEDFPYAE